MEMIKLVTCYERRGCLRGNGSIGDRDMRGSEHGRSCHGAASMMISKGIAESKDINLPKKQELRNWVKTVQISHERRDSDENWMEGAGRICRLRAHWKPGEKYVGKPLEKSATLDGSLRFACWEAQ